MPNYNPKPIPANKRGKKPTLEAGKKSKTISVVVPKSLYEVYEKRGKSTYIRNLIYMDNKETCTVDSLVKMITFASKELKKI